MHHIIGYFNASLLLVRDTWANYKNVLSYTVWWRDRKTWKIKQAYFSRPKMKALNLMLLLVSSEYWQTFKNRLCKTRVEGPGVEGENIFLTFSSYHIIIINILLPFLLPSCVEASTTLQGWFLRCPIIRSRTYAFSPSCSISRMAGHRYFKIKWPTLGLTELLPSLAWNKQKGGDTIKTLWLYPSS